jgi:hypothetical protein
MSPNHRRIHGVTGIVGHGLSERRGDDLPDTGLAPSSETLIDRHPLAVLLRHIAPGRTGSDAPQDAIDNHAVVERRTALASPLSGQKIPQQTPLAFGQIAATQSCLPPRGILESISESRVNLFVNRT